MKYLKQLATIMLITALGVFLKYFLPFPYPEASMDWYYYL